MGMISSHEFARLLSDKVSEKASGKPLYVLDVRTPAEVRAEHINASIHIPVQNCNEDTLTEACIKHHIPPAADVYVLCQSGARADTVIKNMSSSFQWTLHKIDGGLNALKVAGIETESSGASVMSLERQVRIAAGSLVVLGVVLSTLFNPSYIWLSGFVGAGLIFAGVTNTCGMGLLISRMPWNNR